jgi:hypothetical protein
MGGCDLGLGLGIDGEGGGRLRSLPAVEMTKAGEGRDDGIGRRGWVGGWLRSLPLVEMVKRGKVEMTMEQAGMFSGGIQRVRRNLP